MPLGEYAGKYDVAAEASDSILGTVKNFTVATLADVGSTLWNSIPFTPEVTTEDILNKVDKNALALYEESPDAVRTASLIGGALVPGGIALKLLGRMRAGATAAGYTENGIASAVKGAFTGQRQKKLELEIADAFTKAGPETTSYKNLTRQLFVTNAGQQVLDNVIIEAAVLGTMNAHPYMEDYLKDPLPNFAQSMLIGGVIGVGLAKPFTNAAIRNIEQPRNFEALLELRASGYDPIYERDISRTEAAAIQRHSSNIKILDDMIINPETSGLVKGIADNFRKFEDGQRAQAVLRAAPWVKDADDETRQAVFEILSNTDFVSVDKLKIMNLSKPGKAKVFLAEMKSAEEIESLKKQIAEAKESGGKLFGAERALASSIPETFLTPEGKPAIAFVRLSTGETFAGDVRNVARAADLFDIKKTIDAAADARILTTPNIDTGLVRLSRRNSSAKDDAEFLIELKRFTKLKDSDIPYVTIASDDLARQNAALSYISTLSSEEASRIKFRLRNDYAMHDAIIQRMESGGYGVKPTFLKEAINLAERRDLTFLDQNLSAGASEALTHWIHGGMMVDAAGKSGHVSIEEGIARLRRGFDAFFRSVKIPQGEKLRKLEYVNGKERIREYDYQVIAKEIWEAGQKFRDELRKLADPEGYIYIYRGIYGKKLQGASSVESASFIRSAAENFGESGGPNLHKVHVDNVIGTLGSGPAGEAEVLITNPHHPVVKDLPVAQQGMLTPESSAVKIDVPNMTTLDVTGLYHKYADETTRQVRDMLDKGLFSFEEISARTNTTVDAVKAVYAGRGLDEYEAEWRRYVDVKKMDEYLSPRNKLYAIMGNPEKNANSKAMSNMDRFSYDTMHKEQMRQMTLQSNAMIGNDVLDLYGLPEMKLMIQRMEGDIAEVSNASVGGSKIQSADNMLRNLANGPTITYLGKELINRRDAMVKRILEPLAAAFTPFKGRPELFAEFNNTVNKFYSLRGWRDMRIDPESGYGFIVQRESQGGQLVEVPLKNTDGTVYYIKQQEVIAGLEATRSVSNEMLKTHNLIRMVAGHAPMNDLGFYLPPINIVNKNIAYVIDNTGKEPIQLLVANTNEELITLKNAFEQTHADKIAKKEWQVNTKAEQGEWNLAKGYTDGQPFVTYADNAAFHTGSSAQKIVPSDDRMMNNIMAGYENTITNAYRKYAEMYLNGTTAWLDKLSDFYTRAAEMQPKRGLWKEKPKDAATAVKNVLLGRDQLEESVGLKAVNSVFDFLYNRASTAINNTVRSFQSEQVGSKEFFDKLNQTLTEKGVQKPWNSFDEYLATTVPEARNIAPRIQSAANGLLATLNLRMFEVAQAAVNVMSLPILTYSALMEKLPGTRINPQGDMIKFPLETMMNGMKHMWSADGKRLTEMWEQQGLIKQVTRQYTEVTAALKGAGQGTQFMDRAIDAANAVQNNKWIKDVFSKPADFAEELTRKFAMHTGYLAAKQAYPGIDDTAATIAAVAFADRTIGNYHAAQRPAMFQGTFGAAIGLYQTYVLTYAQSIYRSLENRNFKQLAGLAIAQSGIFGIASWPGYNLLSEHVVGHMSDQHIDLTTGTYRAVGDDAARLILYGLPSSIGPAFYTRGDVSPRVPSTMTEIAVFNGIKQGWSAATQIVTKAGEGLQEGTFSQSMFEALSLQSLNRPIARWAEMVSGSTITSKFNTVTPTSEMFTPAGIFSRIIGTRPMEEQVVRDAIHKNRYYEALDKDRRDEAVDRLATAIRKGDLNDTIISDTAAKYLRFGGSAQGWQSALNKVMIQAVDGSRLDLLRKLEPDNPINRMIADHY